MANRESCFIRFADAVFAAVLLWAPVLGNVPGRAARQHLLREGQRVLQPGGCLSFSVHTRPELEALCHAAELEFLVCALASTVQEGSPDNLWVVVCQRQA